METEVQIQNYLVIVTVKPHLSGNRLQDNIFPCFSLSDYLSQCGLASRVLDYEKDINLINTYYISQNRIFFLFSPLSM